MAQGGASKINLINRLILAEQEKYYFLRCGLLRVRSDLFRAWLSIRLRQKVLPVQPDQTVW